jgi:predicted lipoprotein with Yx(FWY)xxD motif
VEYSLRPDRLRDQAGLSCERKREQTMIRIDLAACGIAVALLLAACAGAPVKYSDGVMTESRGMTLYTFDKDPVGAGKSVCNGPCAKNWPPFMATSSDKASGDWSIITRDDGSRQWAYKGKPLYLWAKDMKPGDKTGDGVNKVWHVVKEEVIMRGSYY